MRGLTQYRRNIDVFNRRCLHNILGMS